MTTPLNNIAKNEVEALVVSAAHEKKDDKSKKGLFAYLLYLLMDVETVVNEGAFVKAKQVQAFGHGEVKFNQRLQDLKWKDVPNQVKKTYWVTVEKKLVWRHGGIYEYIKKDPIVKVKNQTEIDAAMQHNREIEKEKGIFQKKIGVLQQESKTQATGLNTTVNESSKVMSEEQSLLETTTNLTYAALLTSLDN